MRLQVKDDLASTSFKNELEDIDSSPPSFMDYEASTNQNQCGLRCIDVLPHSSSDIFGKETNSYSNKAVAQIKIPNTVVYTKADSHPIVKDICVDEGLYCSDKVSSEKEVSEKKLMFAKSMNKDLNVQMTDGSPPDVQDAKFISTIDKSNGDHSCSWNLPETGEKPNTVDHVQCISYLTNISSELLVSPRNFDRDSPHVYSISHQRQCIAKETNENTCSAKNALALGATELGTSIGAKENLTDHISDILVDGYPAAVDSVSDGRRNNYSSIKENPTPVEREVGSMDSRLELTSATAIDVTTENVDVQEILQAKHCSISGMTVPDRTVGPSQSSLYHDNLGDFKFSGPKASSGHIAFSGNISMRSDSSATSTRSFAFPILQTEWNTSPVQMARARKHRSWMMGLICCKF